MATVIQYRDQRHTSPKSFQPEFTLRIYMGVSLKWLSDVENKSQRLNGIGRLTKLTAPSADNVKPTTTGRTLR
ncbi:unnamed protein product [Microthlaspi erraticum]|uniref:Uncharacterized protein n=1 Tax=Microthlaspi erraticum TaxID=1685480 RepID=A0A6D2J324_9BRAS|nr:unnamed protein product [Microthlaspi erraticum]